MQWGAFVMRARGNLPDLAFGLFLVALALFGLYGTRSLSIGTASDMGPGYVPRALEWAILASGIGFVVKGLLAGFAPMPSFAWRPLLTILAAVAVFALCFQWLGLFIAVVAAIVIAGMAQRPIQPHVLLPFGAVVAALSALLFVRGLGLPLKLWPW
jgi:Tripartite tricarboxylate transporter TctB family